jgi:hypothetical protein
MNLDNKIPLGGLREDLQGALNDYGHDSIEAIIGAYNAAAQERGGNPIKLSRKAS